MEVRNLVIPLSPAQDSVKRYKCVVAGERGGPSTPKPHEQLTRDWCTGSFIWVFFFFPNPMCMRILSTCLSVYHSQKKKMSDPLEPKRVTESCEPPYRCWGNPGHLGEQPVVFAPQPPLQSILQLLKQRLTSTVHAQGHCEQRTHL